MNTSVLAYDQLLATKFFIPSSSHALIARPRLTDLLLKASLERNLTLVSAPAGFGKTTLLAAWVHSLSAENLHVAWVSLDEEDNDPVRFWTYVIAALDRQQPGRFTPLLTYLLAQETPPLSSVVKALINTMLDGQEPFLLVLDDYHLITEQAVHASFATLIERLPPHNHLLLATRTDPPLPLSRLRARGQVLEVRTDQLRCTTQEAAAFLEAVMGITLSEKDAQEVTARTEGWLVGLQMLGLSLQGHDDPGTVLDLLSGSQRYILDYLTDEVLQRQPATLQTFLLRTSILERLSGPLCDAVLQQSRSEQVLEQLERANLFVVSLDVERRWYRYHHLFAEALRYRLERTEQENVPSLHLRASQWYAKLGQTTEAVQHALQARAWELAVNLIEPVTRTFSWRRRELPLLWRWLEQLPAEVVRSRPRLCLAYASILHLAARTKEISPWLQAAEVALEASLSTRTPSAFETADPEGHEREKILGEIVARRALVAAYYGDSKVAFSLCQQALSHLSEQDVFECSIVAYARAMASLAEGQAVATTQMMQETSELMQTAGNIGAAINFMSMAAYFLHIQGKLHEAWLILQRAVELGMQPGTLPSALVDVAHAYQAEVLREWNRLDEALDFARQGIQLAGQAGYTQYVDEIYMVLVRIYLARGELDAAKAAFKDAAQLPLFADNSYYRAWMASVDEVRLWLAAGELEQAIRWMQALDNSERLASPFARERQEVARVRVLLARGKSNEALSRLVPLLEGAAKQGRWGHVIKMRLLEALAYQMDHQEQAALMSLMQAVQLAEPEGYVRSFVDEGPQMAALLSRLRDQQSRRGATLYLDTLHAAFQQENQSGEPTRHKLKQPLLDPLTERELEVLSLLARGASNSEIAQRLVLTVDTVKRHVTHIFSKLEARNRVQAVERARTLGLLSDHS